jgi:hypothetical protein
MYTVHCPEAQLGAMEAHIGLERLIPNTLSFSPHAQKLGFLLILSLFFFYFLTGLADFHYFLKQLSDRHAWKIGRLAFNGLIQAISGLALVGSLKNL